MASKTVYKIWTEDDAFATCVFETHELALEQLKEYLKAQDVEYWLEDGLAGIHHWTLELAEPVYDPTNPEHWRVGDVIQCTTDAVPGYTATITHIGRNGEPTIRNGEPTIWYSWDQLDLTGYCSVAQMADGSWRCIRSVFKVGS